MAWLLFFIFCLSRTQHLHPLFSQQKQRQTVWEKYRVTVKQTVTLLSISVNWQVCQWMCDFLPQLCVQVSPYPVTPCGRAVQNCKFRNIKKISTFNLPTSSQTWFLWSEVYKKNPLHYTAPQKNSWTLSVHGYVVNLLSQRRIKLRSFLKVILMLNQAQYRIGLLMGKDS